MKITIMVNPDPESQDYKTEFKNGIDMLKGACTEECGVLMLCLEPEKLSIMPVNLSVTQVEHVATLLAETLHSMREAAVSPDRVLN